jgi:hypothetical protein
LLSKYPVPTPKNPQYLVNPSKPPPLPKSVSHYIYPPYTTPNSIDTVLAELISLGTTALKTPPPLLTTPHLLLARHYFSKALFFLRLDPSTPPKRVSRVCQKLLETFLLLSQLARPLPERKAHADRAQEFGEAALDNVVMCGDQCMVAQVEFMLACVVAWKVYLGMKSGEDGREGVRVLMGRRVEGLRGFGNVDVRWYEERARVYLGYLE